MRNVPHALGILFLAPVACLLGCSEGPADPPPPPADPVPQASSGTEPTSGREAEGAVEWRLISGVPWDELHERTDDRQWSLIFQFKGALLDRNKVFLMQGPPGEETEKRRLAVRRIGDGIFENKLAVVQLPAGEERQVLLRIQDKRGETHEFLVLDGRKDPALVVEVQPEYLF